MSEDFDDDDISADVEAALRELNGDAPPADAKSSAPETDGPVRDERGRFAPKNEPADQTQPEKGIAEPAQPTIRPMPASLKPEIKARWEKLDPDVQDELIRRDAEVQQAKQEWDKKASRFNKLDEVLSPARSMWELNGVTEDQAIRQLLAAENLLRTDPMAGLQWLAQQYGVHPSQVGAMLQQQQQLQPQGSQVGSELQVLVDQISELRAWKDNAEKQQEQREIEQAERAIADFKARPEGRYFDDVRDQIVKFLDAGAASTLEEAYDLACYANPKIRALLEAQRAEQEKATKAAASARRAAGSVTGAPNRGSEIAPPRQVSHSDDVEADVRAALASIR